MNIRSYWQMKSNRRRLLLLALSTVLLAIAPHAASAQDALAGQVGEPIPCDVTPFGRTLEIGREQELFSSILNTSAPNPNSPDWTVFDLDANTNKVHPIATADLGLAPANVKSLAATAADIDGDGKAEIVQGYTDNAGRYQLVVHGKDRADQSHVENWPNHTQRSMAAGDILGQGGSTQQVVVVSRGGDDLLNVAVFSGTAASELGAPVALWRSGIKNRSQATAIRIATGNLDNDRYLDIVVSLLQSDKQTAQLVYLEYQPGLSTGNGPELAQNLQEQASLTYFVGAGTVGPKDAKLATADVAGSAKDRVALVWDQAGGLGGLSPMLTMRTFDVEQINGASQFVAREQWSTQSNSLNFALTAADLNGDHREEIVVGYDTQGNATSGHLNVVALDLINQNTPNASFTEISHWQNDADGRNMTNFLALSAGDFDKDNRAEVVAAFKDAEAFGHQLVHLKWTQAGLQLGSWLRQDATLDAPATLVFGDWNDDSLRAFVNGRCAKVMDAHITAVDFVPPYWSRIQEGQEHSGSLGMSASVGDTVERSFTYHRADTMSAYVGVSAGISFLDLAEFSASARATGAQEYAMSDTKTTGNGTTTVTTVGQSWDDAAVVYEPAEYKCYSYEMKVGEVAVTTDQAQLRFCQYQSLPNVKPALDSSEMNSWDINNSNKPEYAAAVRDWSSLALFRDAFTDQSSNKGTAHLAVDSEIVHGSFISGTVAQTANEANPWWQVDLGTVQDVTKVRVWSPAGGLANFYLFVSNNPFGPNDKPAILLGRADVNHYSLLDLGSGWKLTDTAASEVTFTTLTNDDKPIKGRYVRIQRADTGVLALAEVQVFGLNHVDPDRYPIDLCDEGAVNFYHDPGCDITRNDGFFKVKLYNPYHGPNESAYVWKKVRGRVLWDGRSNDSLNGLSVTRGNTTREWSMSKENVTTKVEAHEIDNSTSIGAEFEVEGGVGIKVQTGRGMERTTGIATELVQSTSWGNELNMGGAVRGFSTYYDGTKNEWVLQCAYFFQPYYYDVTENSNIGYQHHLTVLDYLVPDTSRTNDLQRTGDLSLCRNGNLPGPMQANNDLALTTPGTAATYNVLANDQGTDLAIIAADGAKHGTVTFGVRTVTYTPAAGFVGLDSFSYTTKDGAGETAVASVTVTVSNLIYSTFLPAIQR